MSSAHSYVRSSQARIISISCKDVWYCYHHYFDISNFPFLGHADSVEGKNKRVWVMMQQCVKDNIGAAVAFGPHGLDVDD